ncbi:MAG: ornithine carbamoyltransferase [Pseudomonadota bacterium]|jgi:ornithine carbamoyltransferase
MRDLLTWQGWSDAQIQELVDFGLYVKANRTYYNGAMLGRSIAMLFQKTSTRTRVSFEAAMTEMGGHAIYIDWMSSNFELTEIPFESRYLSRNVSLIVARMKKHEDLVAIAQGSEVPVVNGCCNLYHPCQSLADMMTIALDGGTLKNRTLCYVGVHNNVTNSLIGVTAALGVNLVLVTPLVNDGAYIDDVVQRGVQRKTLSWDTDLRHAVNNSDYVYTDTWVDMEFFNDPSFAKQKEERLELMLPYQLNHDILKGSKAKVMHDMPIHAGYEISRELVDDPRSIIFNQAENRLDAQKAVIISLLSRR